MSLPPCAVLVLRRLAWSWAAVPSGPLGWVSTRTAFPLLSGTLYESLSQALDLRAEDELLDVACGSGAFLADHAALVRRVAGIDLSDLQVDLARRRLRDRIAAGTAEVVAGDAAALPWPDASFTVVTSMAAFEPMPDPARVLAEMHRVLRPRGRLIANIGSQLPPGTPSHRVMGDALWVWSEEDVRRLVEGAGFTHVAIDYARAWGHDPLSRVMSHVTASLGGDLRIVRAST